MPRKAHEKHDAHGHDAEEELRAKYVQYQLMKQQMGLFAEKKSAVDEQVRELNSTIDALHRLENVAKGEEIWSPLGSGSFVRSNIKDISKVMIAIGAGVVTRETRERAIEILQGRLEELVKAGNETASEMRHMGAVISKLESEIETLAHDAENK